MKLRRHVQPVATKRSYSDSIVKIESVVTPFDELLGSSAEEGRAKLR